MPEYDQDDFGSKEFSKVLSTSEEQTPKWKEDHAKDVSQYEVYIRQAEAKLAYVEAQEIEDLINSRKKFSIFFAIVYILWIAFIVLLTFLRGYDDNFDLSDLVMSVLLGSFTVTILTPALVFARYLFRTKRRNSKSS